MFYFDNKVVYIISPDRWGEMKVSKHHYALTLADKNCQVFFIEPPDGNIKGINIKTCPDHKNISIVKYKALYRGKSILPRFAFKTLLKWQIRNLLKTIGVKPDVLWCFSSYLLEELHYFNARKTVFFAADLFGLNEMPKELLHADLIIGVSDSICQSIREMGYPVNQLNHGLQKTFAQKALLALDSRITFEEMEKKIKIGYIGNLRMEALDHITMQQIIEAHPEADFIFWGSYNKWDSNLGYIESKESDLFVEFLKKAPNVIVKGVKSSVELAQEMYEVDVFWICWKTKLKKYWDGSNSHKILEYLSTGKPLISHFMSSYEEKNLFYMMGKSNHDTYFDFFNRTLMEIKKGESEKWRRERIEYALRNTYEKNLELIQKWLN